MIHNDWVQLQLARERHRDLVRQAEQARLAQQITTSHPQRGHALYHALDFLGRQFVILGEHLQMRHAARHTQSLTHTSRGQS